MKVTTEEFIEILIDCFGHDAPDADAIAYEYENNLVAYILDIGGDENTINEALAYLN